MKRFSSLALFVSLTLAGSAVTAQQAPDEPRPGVTVVRYFQCSLGKTSEAVRMLNEDFRPYAQEQIDAGRLMDYGILTHAWGDEWNVVDYFIAEDMETWGSAWSAILSSLGEGDPEGEMFQAFAELCPDHKDNIYTVVRPPVAAGAM